ncbi:MAG: sulfatase-like hydrolase/transferase [Deltaproteobacteria bacterium]|nr:sulfatase-like hydrolase/transferase [Deltaproteobacteria bacterium]
MVRPRCRARARGWLRALVWRRVLGWLVVCLPAILVLATDASLRGGRLLELRGKYILSYGAALLESGALWGVLLVAASARRGLVRWLAAAALVLLATLAMGGQIYFYRQFSIYLNLDATLFGTSMSDSLFGQLGADSANFVWSVAPIAVAAVALVWLGRWLLRPGRTLGKVARWAIVPVLAATLLIPCSYRSLQASTPDVIYLHAIGGLARQLASQRRPEHVKPGLRHPPPLPPLRARPARARNVLLVITEAVPAHMGCASYREHCPVMPWTNAAAPVRMGLEQMRSASSATAIELAVLWSGLQPTAGRQALHTAPLLFDYAHAGGLESAYWSSHHMMFANSRLYVQDLPTRFQCGASQLDPRADVDLGADDLLLTARIKREIGQLREPFFAVAHYGNTHVPYLIDPADAPFVPYRESKAPGDNEAYRNYFANAVYRQDKTVADLLRFVRALPFGPRTVVLYSSDHGEQFREHGQLGHTGSVFDVEIHVPAWIDAPEGTLTEAEHAALGGYRGEPTFHTDVTPTGLDLLGLWDCPEIGAWRAAMAGGSLLRPGRPERVMALSNCAGVWGCAFENWGVMLGWRKLAAREGDTSWSCYDARVDPAERTSLDLGRCADLVTEAERIFGGLPGRH